MPLHSALRAWDHKSSRRRLRVHAVCHPNQILLSSDCVAVPLMLGLPLQLFLPFLKLLRLLGHQYLLQHSRCRHSLRRKMHRRGRRTIRNDHTRYRIDRRR